METRAHSGGGADPPLSLRFGPFELDLRSAELYKDGRKVRLQEQPYQILRMLLESPGEVVSREEIRNRLWPDDTIVEFDHSINAAVKRLRNTLRDSAEKPRYIETLSRRGYRFIGEVGSSDQPCRAPVSVSNGDQKNQMVEPSIDRSALRIQNLRILIAVLFSVVLALAGAWYYSRRVRTSPLQPLIRLDVDLGNNTVSPGSERGPDAILSPDGTQLVYVSRSKLFTRRLDQASTTELPGTEMAQSPFFSPDGKWVAFFAGEKLKKASTRGGQVIELCNAPIGSAAGGGNWGEDGNIVAAVNLGLSRIPAAGGAAAQLTQPASGEIVHRWPQILPGGKAVLFTAYSSMTGLDGATIEVLSLRDGRRKTIVRGGTWGHYLPTGHLVFVSKGTLFGVLFDLDRLEVRGTPVPIIDDVAYSTTLGYAQIDFSRNGTLVYRSGKGGHGLVTIQWLDSSGHTDPLLPVPGNYLSPTLSPDGGRLLLTSAGDIWVYELKRGSMTRLTFGGGYANPLWTSDGRYIVFRGAQGMFWTRADGMAELQVLTRSSNQQTPWSFTADGKRLAFVEINPVTGADIWTLPMERTDSWLRAGKPEVFLRTTADERTPMFSPDGRWLAYMSNDSGANRVYVRAFPQGDKRQISADRGSYPAWSRNGQDLFFWQYGGDPDNQLMVVSYKARGDSFLPDKPRAWSEKNLVRFGTTRSYDPAPDGKRFVALMPAETPQEPRGRVIFMLNFFDELRRRVPLNEK